MAHLPLIMEIEMGRPAADILTAHLQKRPNGTFRVYWGPKKDRIFITIPAMDEREAEIMRRAADVWLSGEGNPPSWIENSRAYRKRQAITEHGGTDILTRYNDYLKGDVSPGWAETSFRGVTELSEWATAQGVDLFRLSPMLAGHFFDAKLTGLSKETRNRRLSIFRKFYGWARGRGYCVSDPFQGFKFQRGTQKRRQIWFLETKERNTVCKKAMKYRNWIAIWLACYAGLRRKEIAKLRIEDLKLTNNVIHVQETKSPLPRVVELNKTLKTKLNKWLQENGGRDGRVLDWPEARYGWQAAAVDLTKVLRDDLPEIAPEKISWNGFRHTYGSLMVQRGASVDYVCSQLGNTSEVARLHYLSFKSEKKNPFVDML